jgi:uncharacterized membrane protein
VTDATSTSAGSKPRRRTVIAAGLLCGFLALVVIYTNPHAFRSPLAVVVVAAIGLAAVLAQLSLYNRQNTEPVHAPTWLNVLGILLAVGALFADVLRLNSPVAQAMVLGAVLSFSISSAVILHAFRKRRTPAK